MFQLVFDAVKTVAPGLQVVVTEHADINENGTKRLFRSVGEVV